MGTLGFYSTAAVAHGDPGQQAPPLVVAAVSCESRIKEVEFNLGRIERWARKAAGQGAELILFPESGIQGWWQSRENRSTAETLQGASVRRLVELAGELDVILAVGLTERRGERFYITHVLLGAKGVLGVHRKSSLSGGKEGEGAVWDEGSDANVFSVKGRRVGISICYESVQPETCSALRKGGAEIILAPYANGTHPAEILDPERRQRKWVWERATENKVWYVACDATPHDEEGKPKPGAAYVISPEGRLVACSAPDRPGEAMVLYRIPAGSPVPGREGRPSTSRPP